jgi:hypothetical protein
MATRSLKLVRVGENSLEINMNVEHFTSPDSGHGAALFGEVRLFPIDDPLILKK